MHTLVERFWEKVDVRGPDECWPWTAGCSSGYGRIGCGTRRRSRYAHVVSYEIHKGPVPKGLYVLHSCDNPPCCNPKHLNAGTPQQNMLDKIERGRGNNVKGEKCPSAKLSEADIETIRNLYATGKITHKKLGEEFSVSKTTIRKIVLGRKWAYLPLESGQLWPLDHRRTRGEKTPTAVLTEVKVVAIKRRIACGETDQSIAKDYNVHKSSVRNIRIGKTWKHVTVPILLKRVRRQQITPHAKTRGMT